jgi:hypothetical protein
MAESIRELIMQNIETELKKITAANGYNNTLGRVSRFQQAATNLATVPVVIVQQGPEVSEPIPNKAVTRELTVRIRIIHRHDPVVEGKNSDQVLNSIQQDIHKALFVDHTRGGLAIETNPAPREVAGQDGEGMGQLDDGMEAIGKTLEYMVRYRHAWQDESVAA